MKKYLIVLALAIAAPVVAAEGFVMDQAEMDQAASLRKRADKYRRQPGRYGQRSYDWVKGQRRPLISSALPARKKARKKSKRARRDQPRSV